MHNELYGFNWGILGKIAPRKPFFIPLCYFQGHFDHPNTEVVPHQSICKSLSLFIYAWRNPILNFSEIWLISWWADYMKIWWDISQQKLILTEACIILWVSHFKLKRLFKAAAVLFWEKKQRLIIISQSITLAEFVLNLAIKAFDFLNCIKKNCVQVRWPCPLTSDI